MEGYHSGHSCLYKRPEMGWSWSKLGRIRNLIRNPLSPKSWSRMSLSVHLFPFSFYLSWEGISYQKKLGRNRTFYLFKYQLNNIYLTLYIIKKISLTFFIFYFFYKCQFSITLYAWWSLPFLSHLVLKITASLIIEEMISNLGSDWV